MKCSSCKNNISKGSSFCEQCGRPIKSKKAFLWIPLAMGFALVITGLIFVLGLADRKTTTKDFSNEDIASEIKTETKIETIEPQKEPSELLEIGIPKTDSPKIDNDWIYYSLGEENNEISKFNVKQDKHLGLFHTSVPIKEWDVVGDKIVYTTDIDWDELTSYYDPQTGRYNFPNNGFINGIYTANMDGSQEQCIVEGDLYGMHNPDEPNMFYDYEILLVHDNWIYFQTHFAAMESDAWDWGANLSKVRVDGSNLTKLNDWGVGGPFAGIINGKAYFDAPAYGEFYDEIISIDLKTGEREEVTSGAYIVGIQGDTLYYHVPDYSQQNPVVQSINFATGEEEGFYVSDYRDYQAGYYLDGDTICYDDYVDGTNIIYNLDLNPKEIRNIAYGNYWGINKNGYRYYTTYANNEYELHKKNTITGDTEKILASEAPINLKFR